jgi:hypothetical protein
MYACQPGIALAMGATGGLKGCEADSKSRFWNAAALATNTLPIRPANTKIEDNAFIKQSSLQHEWITNCLETVCPVGRPSTNPEVLFCLPKAEDVAIPFGHD